MKYKRNQSKNNNKRRESNQKKKIINIKILVDRLVHREQSTKMEKKKGWDVTESPKRIVYF